MIDEGIPDFLKIPQDERKAAWEKFRAAKPLPVETKKVLPPIMGIPGVTDDRDDDT